MAGDRELDYIYWDALRDLGSFGRGLVRVSRNYYLDIIRRYEAESLLDLGCAFGDTYALLKSEGFQYAGIDVMPNFIDEAQRRYPGVDFKVGRIQEIPYSDGSFEIVTCRCVLEHLPDPEPAIREMARVSSKAVVVVWFKWPKGRDKLRYDKRGFWENTYSRDRILAVADSAGLELVDEIVEQRHLVWILE